MSGNVETLVALGGPEGGRGEQRGVMSELEEKLRACDVELVGLSMDEVAEWFDGMDVVGGDKLVDGHWIEARLLRWENRERSVGVGVMLVMGWGVDECKVRDHCWMGVREGGMFGDGNRLNMVGDERNRLVKIRSHVGAVSVGKVNLSLVGGGLVFEGEETTLVVSADDVWLVDMRAEVVVEWGAEGGGQNLDVFDCDREGGVVNYGLN